ncbi:MAG: helix-turn-helix domain-containing protein [Actinomycetales bacterium]|nr:helix-turn-helix domain-containing protein [Actinomycetales bacterium]
MTASPGTTPSLGRRLRELRDANGWTQRQLGELLSLEAGENRPLSPALISSWESEKSVPSARWVAAYVRVLTRGSGAGETPRAAQQRTGDLESELLNLRAEALQPSVVVDPAAAMSASAPRFWRFPDGRPICIIAAKLPRDAEEILSVFPYANPVHPNYMPLVCYPDGEAIVELFGHLRAENPGSEVRYKTPDRVIADDLSGHVVIVGGPDFNPYAAWFAERMDLPVASGSGGIEVGDPSEDAAFTVTSPEGSVAVYEPMINGHLKAKITKFLDGELRQVEVEWPNVVYDLGLLARQPNPTNSAATATLCYGLYSRGSYGVARVFTDAQIRDANEQYLRRRFGAANTFWMLVRVLCNQEFGVTTTPDLNRDFTRLVEWPD